MLLLSSPDPHDTQTRQALHRGQQRTSPSSESQVFLLLFYSPSAIASPPSEPLLWLVQQYLQNSS